MLLAETLVKLKEVNSTGLALEKEKESLNARKTKSRTSISRC